MKHAFLASTLVAGLALSLCTAATAASSSPLLGKWSVDTSRMAMPPAARPKSVFLTFSDAGNNRLEMDVDIVYADGKQVHTKGVNPLDGTAVPVVGSPEADAAAMEHPQPNVLVVGLSMGGVPASTRVYSAAIDGKTMSEVVSFYDDKGKPGMRVHYFTRVN
jgi:hypothetical protein